MVGVLFVWASACFASLIFSFQPHSSPQINASPHIHVELWTGAGNSQTFLNSVHILRMLFPLSKTPFPKLIASGL